VTISLEHAIVYDIETLPNAFTFDFEFLHSDTRGTFEISEFRSDAKELLAWFEYWRANRIPMIGFNTLGFDYPVIHFLWNNPDATVWDIHEKAQEQINDHTMFKMVWESDRFAPQIDLFKIHHFDNKAKTTSLKALQVNMRLDDVVEMPLPFDQPIAPWNIDGVLIPYGKHDVRSTKQFAHFSMEAINFRLGLMDTLKGDVLNWSDTKIGAKLLEQRLGRELTHDGNVPRSTPRDRIALNDIIFPYIRFDHPEFNRILSWMRGQVLSVDEFSETIKTKGVFTGVHATIDGFDFWFGTGGIHGSVPASVWQSDDEWAIVDIDVASLYPSIAIVNRLYPEHLGERFVEEYAKLPAERKEWQKKKGKKCVEANSMKLASNGTYGNSNNKYSVFYDPKFTMTITVNGQLLLCMLAEWILSVPTVQIIQINTDGITYRIKREHMKAAEQVRDAWQAYTRLVLEEANYSKMWIRDVNNYIAQPVDGGLPKQKGAYWYPRRFPQDISEAQPPAWHKDFSGQVAIMAAVEHMTKGVSIERYIYDHADPFDFMCRAKVKRSEQLWIGDKQVQRIQRYYVARQGGAMKKVLPPSGPLGQFKRKNGISDHEYYSILKTLPEGTHDKRIHTANGSKYERREMGIESGWLVADCNKASDFDFNNVNYEYYIEQAKKLVVT
jgi:hypothetical protein